MACVEVYPGALPDAATHHNASTLHCHPPRRGRVLPRRCLCGRIKRQASAGSWLGAEFSICHVVRHRLREPAAPVTLIYGTQPALQPLPCYPPGLPTAGVLRDDPPPAMLEAGAPQAPARHHTPLSAHAPYSQCGIPPTAPHALHRAVQQHSFRSAPAPQPSCHEQCILHERRLWGASGRGAGLPTTVDRTRTWAESKRPRRRVDHPQACPLRGLNSLAC